MKKVNNPSPAGGVVESSSLAYFLPQNCLMRVAGWICASFPPCDLLPPLSLFSPLTPPPPPFSLSSSSPPKKGAPPPPPPPHRSTPKRERIRRWRWQSQGGGGMSTRSKSVPVPAGGGAATVPLAVLLRREVVSEKTAAERPELQVGLFSQAKKGEDYTFLKPDCERLPGVPSSSFSAFGVSALLPIHRRLPRRRPPPPPIRL